MGKRKRSLRKENPSRHKAFLRLREMGETQETTFMKNGTEVVLNPMKRWLLQKPYKNDEFQKTLLRQIGKTMIGKEKYEELERKAGGQ